MLTIPELFERTLERRSDRRWLSYEDDTYTYGEAHRRIGSIADALAQIGIEHQSMVFATTRNSADYLFTWLAVMRLGAIFVPVNPASSPSELEGLLAQVRPRLAVTDTELREVVEKSIAETGAGSTVIMVDELTASSGEPPPIGARPDDVSVMIPTSGTTGRSKLVMQTQRAYAMAGEGFPFWMGLTEEDRLMTSLPLFHINAPAYSTLGSVAAGAGLVLLSRFSGSGFLDSARRYGATEFNAIGAMLEILMRQPESEDDTDNPLRLCYTGPTPPRERQLEIERRFDLQLICGYALSESPYGLIWRKGTRPYGTLGSLRQHPTMGEVGFGRVMDGEREVEVGETGELQLKNPALMLGYYDMPEETERVLADGWLRTGDLVTVNDDETFTFVGRKKELIRRRGENLSPLEVEVALEVHPAVAEAAVIGVPSELSEEDVKAFVVLATGHAVEMVELRDFVAERLAPFKVPRYFELVDELPHTPTGRISKPQLARDRNDAEEDLDTRASSGGEAHG
ncbi:MAG: AMP-binding protein [Actinobacteria bacterium]|nr:AMP-binding protein [Actinomycetota bacterium]